MTALPVIEQVAVGKWRGHVRPGGVGVVVIARRVCVGPGGYEHLTGPPDTEEFLCPRSPMASPAIP
ncbi:Uncharacterised protein [Mycobacteroides abscessus subsp. abscessus]|uniref:hypothetical protein n=1 Tax=Mycobacteroides abscessus TaxID=36809 RepID=UPI00092B3DED|nr:hypothetical protein [Mycobacteroides abscessus]SHS67710.1 Uncharacterised protein [Mycobacteroides abscessus subsp. abscessus]SHS87335.1 Uncharacterised protein [Mycobacteroides abscessus subsp. abscessus]SHT71139.1 Uncharacterised protein [Mycobacteroides abscessus subsp. abscessus]SHU92977.1 Uncharacterised protein [Mycobacteroides abscessus subsp. abscessus]SHX08305.1 Uncharacterised protein [Mycobacteroides abscessus subsp. abscessus]